MKELRDYLDLLRADRDDADDEMGSVTVDLVEVMKEFIALYDLKEEVEKKIREVKDRIEELEEKDDE